MGFDVLVKNVTIIDGTNTARYTADVGVENGTISAIGALANSDAALVIDGANYVICPGFIDMHTHSDLSLMDDPLGESMAYQGVTTQVTGNCSYSPFPMGRLTPTEMRKVTGEIFETNQDWRWDTMAQWADIMESQGISLNIAPQVGNTPLRAAVGALEDRPATPDELREMKLLLAETMEMGAFSLTTGLSLSPSGYATTEEIIELSKVAASYGGFYATHARFLPGWHVKMIEEAVAVGEGANIPVQFSHMAIVDRRYYGHGPEMVAVIDGARTKGIDIVFDMYPYTAAGAGLNQLVPLWMQEGGVPKFMERLRDPTLRARARQETKIGREGGIPPLWEIHVISNTNTAQNRNLIGYNLIELAEKRGVEPEELVLQLIEEEQDGIMAVVHNRVESDIRFFLAHPQSMIGSDGNAVSPTGLYKDFKPHPRFYGPYPRILGRYVREDSVLGLEEAIYKMSGFPASRLGLTNRGYLKEGFVADFVLFDPESVIDNATFQEPHRYPTGIPFVFVAGEPIIADGVHTGARPGKVLRNNG